MADVNLTMIHNLLNHDDQAIRIIGAHVSDLYDRLNTFGANFQTFHDNTNTRLQALADGEANLQAQITALTPLPPVVP